MAVVDIKLSQLKIHPKNIRKEYEGIDELAQSIRENGIMQNLTVVPDKDEKGTYFVVIGNRRLTAAREAEIETAPCVIVEGMEERDQVLTMLTENMNRKDLKIYEEAAAIQMCFDDFNFPMEELEKNTGLSKTTLYHRLNVAKLDTKLLAKKVQDEELNLTLADLYALEKVEDVEMRNKILKEARDSRDIRWRASSAARDEIRAKNLKAFTKLCEESGIKKAPLKSVNEIYGQKWDRLKDYDMQEDIPKEIKAGKKGDELFYYEHYGTVYIIRKAAKEEKKLTAAEEAAKAREKKQREIKKKYKELFENMGNFVRGFFDDKCPELLFSKLGGDLSIFETALWKILASGGEDGGTYVSYQSVAAAILGKPYWNADSKEREEALEEAKRLPIVWQKLAIAYWNMQELRLTEWSGEYRKRGGDRLKAFIGILQQLDYIVEDETVALMNGTHDLYEKKEEK